MTPHVDAFSRGHQQGDVVGNINVRVANPGTDEAQVQAIETSDANTASVVRGLIQSVISRDVVDSATVTLIPDPKGKIFANGTIAASGLQLAEITPDLVR